MRIYHAAAYALSAYAALAMLPGCSSGASQVSPPTVGQAPGANTQSSPAQVVQNSRVNNSGRLPSTAIVSGRRVTTPSFMNPDAAAKPLVFVSDLDEGVVNIYLQRAANKMVGQITNLNAPQGIAADTARNLYIVEVNNLDVSVYAPPYTNGAKLKLTDPGYIPVDVAVSRHGVVGVANQCSYPSCGPGSITLYAKDSTTPCATVIDATNFAQVRYAAFDAAGDLFIEGNNSSARYVVGEITGGCKAKKMKLLTTTNTLQWGGGVQIDKTDRVALLDYDSSPGAFTIFTYNQPQKGSLGSAVSTTTLTDSQTPEDFAFLASGANVYTVDPGIPGSNEYSYSAGGLPERTISGGFQFPYGVAVTPPIVP
jgi:hypothetical protein